MRHRPRPVATRSHPSTVHCLRWVPRRAELPAKRARAAFAVSSSISQTTSNRIALARSHRRSIEAETPSSRARAVGVRRWSATTQGAAHEVDLLRGELPAGVAPLSEQPVLSPENVADLLRGHTELPLEVGGGHHFVVRHDGERSDASPILPGLSPAAATVPP